MSKSPRLARLIDLIPYITRHQGIPIDELAKKFEVSVEDLDSDLNLLWCCGLPGQTPLELMEISFLDGYVSVKNADELKHPRSLTQTEIATLVIGLELLSKEGNTVAENLAVKLRSKLKAQIAYEPSNAERFVSEIISAIQKNQLIEITYESKSRQLIPIEIYSANNQSYLRAYCKRANANRTFRIGKITELKMLPNRELPPNDVPTDSVKLQTRIKVHKNQRLVREQLGGSVDIEYFSTHWLVSKCMALAGAVELLDGDLRQALLARARASQKLYLG